MINMTYLSGVIASSYDQLLTKAQLKSFEALTKGEFLSLLKKYHYGDTSLKHFDNVMLSEEIKLKEFLKSNLGSNDLLYRLAYLHFDHLFISSMLKEIYFGIKLNNLQRGLSTLNEEAVEDYLRLGVDIYIDQKTKSLIDDCLEKINDFSAQSMSDYLILRLYSNLYDEIKQTKKLDPSLLSYYQALVTVDNLLLVLRAKRYDMGSHYVKENLIPGSFIEPMYLVELYDRDINHIADYLRLHYNEEVVDAIKHDDSPTWMKNVSHEFDEFLYSMHEHFSYQSIGYGAIIDFLMRKRLEIKTLKRLYYESKGE